MLLRVVDGVVWLGSRCDGTSWGHLVFLAHPIVLAEACPVRCDGRSHVAFGYPGHGAEALVGCAVDVVRLGRDLVRGFGYTTAGDGSLLDLLAPVFERVVGVDRSSAQLERAGLRIKQRGYANVELVQAELGDAELLARVGAGADVVVAARVLHHAPLPRVALSELLSLLRPGGKLLVIDYCRHTDEHMAAAQADVWLGFEAAELTALSREAGFEEPKVVEIPRSYASTASDGHVGWQLLVASRPE